jgi:hypothetical protein
MAPDPRPTFRMQAEEALGAFAGIVGYLLFQVARCAPRATGCW